MLEKMYPIPRVMTAMRKSSTIETNAILSHGVFCLINVCTTYLKPFSPSSPMLTPALKETRWQKDFERPIYELWKKKQLYRFITASKKKIFSIDTPPPYVNAPVHIGQATTYVLMDMFARFHRMLGDNVLFPLGLDRNGLPIEVAAEKRFGIKFNQVGREEFIKKCESILQESSLASVEAFLRLGIGFNSWDIGD